MIDEVRDPLPRLPERKADSHKGDYGRVLVVGGSWGMAGAPALAGMAALRSGAGLVSVAAPRCVQATVAAFCPAYTTRGLADDGERLTSQAGPALGHELAEADAAAIGPGLGHGDGVVELVGMAWAIPKPMVFDADALNALSVIGERRVGPGAPRVLTPHAGEFARLSGKALADPNDDVERRERAAELARSLGEGVVILLKGPRTVVTDGERYATNASGNPGMATGGSGDVLTGVILALLGQGFGAFDAARLAAHAHGLAGDLAASHMGTTALMAPDLVDSLPGVWRELEDEEIGGGLVGDG